MALAPQLPLQPETDTNDELTRYLGGSPTRPCSPCVFWKENEHNFPVLASFARDVLAVPATGSGVKRLFNSARDICHYGRGSLKSKTIQDLIMLMCTSKFEIESEQLALMEEYISMQETQTRTEEEVTKEVRDPEFDPISDTEEDPSGLPTQPRYLPSAVALGKRPRQATPLSDLEEDNEDEKESEEDEIPLPDNIHAHDQSNIQRRTSGRVPKRSKRDGQWDFLKL